MTRRLLFTLVLCLVTLGGFAAPQADRGPDFVALRARWERKSPEERALLRQRFEELSRLRPEAREELQRRARVLTGDLRTLESEPPPWVRERLDGARPGERDRELRRCLEDHHRRRGSDLRARMPADLVARLEAATTDEERALVFRELHQRAREEMFPYFVERIARRLELDAAEVERLKATPSAEREAVIRGLKRRMIVERGKPKSVSEADWDSWQALDDAEFLRRVELSGGSWRGGRRGDGRGGRHGESRGRREGERGDGTRGSGARDRDDRQPDGRRGSRGGPPRPPRDAEAGGGRPDGSST